MLPLRPILFQLEQFYLFCPVTKVLEPHLCQQRAIVKYNHACGRCCTDCQVFVNVSNILDTKNDNITSTTQDIVT